VIRVLAVTLLCSTWALAEPVTYALDEKRSELLAITTPKGVLKGVSHPHVVRASTVKGKILFDVEDISASSVEVTVPVSSLVVDEPRVRSREGMKPFSEDDRKKVAASMLSEKQLDAQRFPRISFQSARLTRTGERTADVTGELEIHGVKKTVTMPITWSLDDGQFRGEGTLTVNHSDFEMKPFTAALGTIRNAEPIRLKVKLVGAPQR
jgi:polyisoprenoid-binding protein YceI